jgi:adenine-specific DNA methylase
VRAPDDTAAVRKARGAFFTPEPITRFIADWAIRSWDDRVLEPSAGDAAFLVEAVRRLRELGVETPKVEGIEIHDHSARIARRRIREAGGSGRVSVSDFFEVAPRRHYDAVIGNPPYLRYQDWSGSMRERSRTAALRAGVRLTGLASSWAAFTVQSAMFLREGGRLGLVLPAELLSVNYAAPVRRFLFEHFRSIDLILFEKQVFEDAEADTLLLLADGYLQGATDHARVRQVFDAHHLGVEGEAVAWSPVNPSDKWVGSLTKIEATHVLDDLARAGDMVGLRTWGKTSLGIVTGNNRYFALTTERINELGLEPADLIPLSPPGSGHLRELDLDRRNLTRLAEEGSATWLFRPQGEPSPAARAYIAQGEQMGVDRAYKCRVRSTWWRVPYLRPADLLLTYMNADAVRIVTNAARVHHLNSVHGIYLEPGLDAMGRDLLPLASLNSVTMLSGELTGRSYGGGILKMEPREADRWLMPSPDLVWSKREELQRVRRVVLRQLREGQLRAATHIVDEILFGVRLSTRELADVRDAHEGLQARRTTRSKRG